MTVKSDAKIEENPILCFKNDKNFVLIRALKNLKSYTLIGPFCAKYITFDLKKYRVVFFDDTGKSCKIWRKTDLWLGKWHEEFGKFSPKQLEVSKLGLWWDSFVQSRKWIR